MSHYRMTSKRKKHLTASVLPLLFQHLHPSRAFTHSQKHINLWKSWGYDVLPSDWTTLTGIPITFNLNELWKNIIDNFDKMILTKQHQLFYIYIYIYIFKGFKWFQ